MSCLTLPHLHTEWTYDGGRPALRRDLVGSITVPLEKLAMLPEGVVRARLLVDGWDDVVAARLIFAWDRVRCALPRRAVNKREDCLG